MPVTIVGAGALAAVVKWDSQLVDVVVVVVTDVVVTVVVVHF